MKKIFKYLSVVAGVAFVATSCNMNDYPVFDDADAFVAMDKYNLSVSEEAGKVEIPVSLASVAGLSSTVSYSVTDGTAVEGVNFTTAESKTLEFSSDKRTVNIEIDITDLDAEYTGDLSFTVTLTDAGKVDLGGSVTCEVTITDADHPLMFILGDYEVEATDSTDSPYNLDLTISEVRGDAAMVYFAVEGEDGQVVPAFYGNVNGDKTQIIVPLGQKTLLEDSTLVLHGAIEEDGSIVTTDSGNMIITISEDGELEFVDYAPALYDSETKAYTTTLKPGLTVTKK